MHEVLPALDRWWAAGRRAAIATVARARGSSPRPVGARMAIAEHGEFAGSISVGCVEADVFDMAQQVIRDGRPRRRHFGIADDLGLIVGLSCGGEIDVWIEPDWLHRPDEEAVAVALRRSLAAEEGACLATLFSAESPARHVLIAGDGTVVGGSGHAALDATVVAEARACLHSGVSATIEIKRPDGSAVEVLLDAYLPPATLLVFGGTHAAMALVAFAKKAGFRTIVVDGRSRFADPARFPEADQVLLAWPEEAGKQLRIDGSTYVAVLNHDPKFDEPALKLALARGARYVGALGSRRTHGRQMDRLRAQGISEEDLARIHGPVGLDIGARSPEEIAVSILAEIIAERYHRPGGMLYRSTGDPHSAVDACPSPSSDSDSIRCRDAPVS